MCRTHKFLMVFFLVLNLAGGAAATDYASTCRYFKASAFNDLHTRDDRTFRTDIAHDCQEALAILRWPGDPEAAREAQRYLDALHSYRQVLLEMARGRYKRDVRKPGLAAGLAFGRPVTRSGEILIARVIGLSKRRQDWAAWKQARAD